MTKVCGGQTVTGEADTMLILEDGTTFSKVIIGPNQAEEAHCKGTCTFNSGDMCTIMNSCQNSGKSCDRFTGNTNGDEPTKIGSGPGGAYCKVTKVKYRLLGVCKGKDELHIINVYTKYRIPDYG
ncbi:hypothetical protein F5X99DRAFT_352046 [Biscogniauxia marginata]|nr:hypothetical protein F5X99DRAFT_352046 [Biscogniauxia marginata]